MIYNLQSLINSNIPILYEQAFLHFLKLGQALYYYPTIIPKQNNGTPAPVYRSVIHNTTNFQFEYIEEISKISYRPENDVTRYGRMNRPLQGMFYASGEIATCWAELENSIILELVNKDEIAITTGQWILNRDIKVAVIPDFDNKEMAQFIDKIESLNMTDVQRDVLKGINELFRHEDENSNVHQVTSAFCNAVLCNSMQLEIKIDGFIYTSVKNGTGYNLALFPDLIDNMDLRLESANRNIIQKIDLRNKLLGYMPPKQSKSIDLQNGSINW